MRIHGSVSDKMRHKLFCLAVFAVLEKFCLAHGLRQLTRDTKYDVSCLQTSFTCHNKKPNSKTDVLRSPSYNVNCKKLMEIMRVIEILL